MRPHRNGCCPGRCEGERRSSEPCTVPMQGAAPAQDVVVDRGRYGADVGDGALEQIMDLVHSGLLSDSGSSAARSSRRRSSPLAVWLFTVPCVQPSAFAVSATSSSTQCRSTT